MTVTDLLTELRQCGIELEARGEQLRYRPKDALTPDQRAVIHEHKAELVALLSKREDLPEPSRRSRLAASGLHHNDVQSHDEVLFLFATELIADPSRAREDCQTLPSLWAHYAPFWSERLPGEALEELEARYRRRLQLLGLQEEARTLQGPKPLRAFTLNAEGTRCAECGSADYWVMAKGDRYCLACHPAFYKDVIAIGTIQTAEEKVSRPSMRRKAGGGRATR